MKRILKFLWRRKWFVIITILVVFILIKLFVPQSKPQVEVKEYTVSKGTVSSTINSTGDVEAGLTQDLTFGLQGRISELKYKVGDTVNKGDYIGSLDTTSLQAQLKIAQGGLQSASANYANTKQSLDSNIQEITNEVTELDKQIAESSNTTAKQVNKNTINKAQIDVKIAKKGVEASEETVDNLEEEKDISEDVSDANTDVAELTGNEAEDLAEAQKDLSQFKYESQIEDSKSDLDIKGLQTDQKAIDFNNTKLNSNHSDVLGTLTLEKAVKAVELGDTQKQQIDISKKNTLNSLSGQITNAQGNVELAQYNLTQAKLYAPFSGTILKMPFKVGEFFSGPQTTEIIQLGDLSSFIVNSEVNEVDILQIEADQKAFIEFEADPGIKYEGKVLRVNPAPVIDASGVVNYKVEISLPLDIKKIYHGLSVNIEIVTEEKTDIIQIPFVALQRKEDGQYVRVKNSDGTISDKKVEIGLQSISNVEILSGLEEGDVIVY